MNKKSYSEKLRDPRWQKLRLEVLNRDNWACQLCEDKGTELHIHHRKYNGEPWQADLCDLLTLCKHCHIEVEGLKEIIDVSEISILKIMHGNTLGHRAMFIAVEDVTLMIIYDHNDQVASSFGFGIGEMRSIRNIFDLASQRRLICSGIASDSLQLPKILIDGQKND